MLDKNYNIFVQFFHIVFEKIIWKMAAPRRKRNRSAVSHDFDNNVFSDLAQMNQVKNFDALHLHYERLIPYVVIFYA